MLIEDWGSGSCPTNVLSLASELRTWPDEAYLNSKNIYVTLMATEGKIKIFYDVANSDYRDNIFLLVTHEDSS